MKMIQNDDKHAIEHAMRVPTLENGFVEYASAAETSAEPPMDMHQIIKTGDMPEGITNPKAVAKALLDVDSWLPFAAEAYQITADLRDIIVVPTTIFLTDLPNANLAAFPFEEMSAWNAQAGNITYKTWAKKPCHIEHANGDPTKAAGVIFDSSMRKVPNYLGGVSRVVLLAGWDRNRYPKTAEKILAGRSGFSMGAWVNTYQCGVCKNDFRSGECAHFMKSGRDFIPRMSHVYDKLVYRIARGPVGFELSSVENPAWRNAFGLPIG